MEEKFLPQNAENIQKLVGVNDGNLKLIEDGYEVALDDLGQEIKVTGPEDQVKTVMRVLKALDKVAANGINLTPADVVSAMKMADKGTTEYFGDL